MNQNQLKFIKKWENEGFSFCNVDWWPLIKIQICYQLALHEMNAKTYSNNFSESPLLHVPKFKFGFLKAYLKQLLSISKEKANVAIFTDSKHKVTNFNNNIVNQYTDPFVYLFNDSAISYDVYDLNNNYRNPIIAKPIIQFFLRKVIKNFNLAIELQDKLWKMSLFLRRQVGNEVIDFYSLIANAIVKNQSIFLAYKLIFKKNIYKSILYYCYYNNDIMAINRAGNLSKIKTIEYQHSQISSEHLAYTNWSSIKPTSQQFFPSHIWSWRESDVKLLKLSFNPTNTLKAFRGGNVFAAMNNGKKVKYLNYIVVIVTLQGFGLPQFIIDFINHSINIFWYIRLHPRYPNDRLLAENIKKSNNTKVDIEDANKLSLYELFQKADYNLTCYSGSAIEAQIFGVQNIIWGEKGYQTYKSHILNNSYFFVNNYSELNSILLNKRVCNSTFDDPSVNLDDVKANIRKYFG